MTASEAMEILKNGYLGDSELMKQAKFTAVEALKKQIPKKPDYEDYDAKCPVCGHEFENNVNDWGCSFCQGCAQKLDWSD